MKTGKVLTLLLAAVTMTVSLPIHAIAMIGDLNNDGVVDKQDAKLLTEYFAGYDRNFDHTSADVDADGQLTRKDGMILNRYTDGWDRYEIPYGSTLNTKRNEELSAIAEQNDGELPEIYLDAKSSIPQAILGNYSNTIVTGYDSAIESLADIQNLMLIDSPVETFTGLETSVHNNTNFYKIQQMYKGIPVYGKELIITTDKEGNILSLTGDYTPLHDVNIIPAVTAEEALSLASEACEYDNTANAELVIYTDAANDTLAWLFKDAATTILVDAATGDILYISSNLLTSSYGGAALNGEIIVFPVDYENEMYYMRDIERNIRIYNAGNKDYETIISMDRDWDNIQICSPNNEWDEDYAIAASLLSKLIDSVDYYENVIGLDSFDNSGSPIYGFVNLSMNRSNEIFGLKNAGAASVSGFCAIICTTPTWNEVLPYQIIGHEYTHAVEKAHSNTTAGRETSAICEAYSDIMGELIEEYYTGSCDWDDHTGLARCIKNPSSRYDSSFGDELAYPEVYNGDGYYTGRKDDYGAHHNSTVISHTIYNLHNSGVIDSNTLANLLFNTLQYISRTCDFAEYRVALYCAAKHMGLSDNVLSEINTVFDAAQIPNETISGLYPEGHNIVSGTVYDEDTSIPLTGFSTKLRNGWDNQTGDVLNYVQDNSSSSNVYRYCDLPEGKYTIEVSLAGYKTTYKNITSKVAYSASELCECISQDVYMSPITTHIVSGMTLPAWVTVACSNGTVVTADAAGHYSFTLPDGTYTLTFTLDGYETTTRTVTVNGSDCTIDAVTMEANDTITLSGIVTDANGALAGVTAALLSATGQTAAVATSDDAGTFTLVIPSYGTYTLTLTKSGYGAKTVSNLVIAEDTTTLGSYTMVASIYPKLQYYNGHTYALIDERMSWDDAIAFCEKTGGHLVTITSQEENAFLMDKAFYTTDNATYYPSGAWIGFSDAEEEGNWKWVTGEAVTYTNWVEPCPEDTDGNKDYAILVPVDSEFFTKTGYAVYKAGWHNIVGATKLNWGATSYECRELICEWDSLVDESVFVVDSGTCGDAVTWKLDVYDTLTISGTGDIWDYDYWSSPWYTYEDSVQKIIVEEGITRIGDHAFELRSSSFVQSPISLPSTLLSIGKDAFAYIGYSVPLYLPGNLKIIEDDAFFASDFTEIHIPASVEKIGYSEYSINPFDELNNVFSNNFYLTKIVVDEANPYFCSEDGILYTKDMSTLITYPEGKTGDTYVMPNSVSAVVGQAFGMQSSIKDLKNITISASLSNLSTFAYSNVEFEHYDVDLDSPYFCAIDGVVYSKDMTRLELYPKGKTAYTYDVLDGTKVIANHAFDNCNYLLTLNLPDSITTIGRISYCPLINNLVVPSQVTSIDVSECSNLTDIYFLGDAPSHVYTNYAPSSLTFHCIEGKKGWTVPTWTCSPQTYKTAYFDPDTVNLNTIASGTCGNSITWKIDKDGVISLRGTGPMEDYRSYSDAPWYNFKQTIRKVIIGEGITSIGKDAFSLCELVEKISLPSTLTSIGEDAFLRCESVEEVRIPDGVTTIDERAFSGCDKLAQIYVPASVNSIGYYAFSTRGSHIYFYGDVPTTWSNYALGYTDYHTIHYIEGKSGWTTPTWTAPDGTVYNTAIWNP